MQKTIEITTTQNVTIEYERATLGERVIAFAIDLFILLIFWLIVFFVVIIGLLKSNGEIATLIYAILSFASFFLYNFCFEIWNRGQTPGKKAMNIKVVRLDGKDPEWGDVVLRAMLHLVDTLFCSGIIGSVLINTTAKSQRFGDMAAHTTVIKIFSSSYNFRLENILNISSLQTYTPVYPQVRKLSERDMLFIKNLLNRHTRYPNQAHHEAVEDLVTRLLPILDIQKRPANRIEFLKTLLQDYVVLTR